MRRFFRCRGRPQTRTRALLWPITRHDHADAAHHAARDYHEPYDHFAPAVRPPDTAVRAPAALLSAQRKPDADTLAGARSRADFGATGGLISRACEIRSYTGVP